MFARGVLSLHIVQLSVPKTPASNSRVSITSKLIETKRLQVLHSGHLRKTGGGGSYQLCKAYPARPSTLRATEHGRNLFTTHQPALSVAEGLPRTRPKASPKRRRRLARRSFSVGGCFPYLRKTGGYAPTQKCRRADILDFSPDFSHFLALSAGAKGRHSPTRRSFSGGGPLTFPPLSSAHPNSPSNPRAFPSTLR